VAFGWSNIDFILHFRLTKFLTVLSSFVRVSSFIETLNLIEKIMIIENLSRLTKGAAIAMALSIGAITTQASAVDPEKRENVDYLTMTLVDFKAGTRTKAIAIIAESFTPAAIKAGTPQPWVMHFQTGSWDMVLFWDLKNGMADMEWDVSPDNIKWKTAFDELSGGAEKADAIYAEYLSYIARSKTNVGHHHKMKAEKED